MAFQPVGSRIELKHADAEHDVLGRIHVPVVVDPIPLAANPLPVRPQVRLRRAPFDLIPDGILFFVRVRNVVVIEREKSPTQSQTGDKNGHCQAIKTDASRLKSRYFVVFG